MFDFDQFNGLYEVKCPVLQNENQGPKRLYSATCLSVAGQGLIHMVPWVCQKRYLSTKPGVSPVHHEKWCFNPTHQIKPKKKNIGSCIFKQNSNIISSGHSINYLFSSINDLKIKILMMKPFTWYIVKGFYSTKLNLIHHGSSTQISKLSFRTKT